MEHEVKFVKTKQEKKSKNTDDNDIEALNFIEMFPSEPETQTDPHIIPDGKLESLETY